MSGAVPRGPAPPTVERERLREANEALRRQVVQLERARQVEQEASARLAAHVEELQARVLALREEVTFYRGIVSSRQSSGTTIQTLRIEPEGATNVYRFQVVLTRNRKSDTVASGTLTLSITGEQDGEVRRLALSDVSPGRETPIAFQLQHFQRLDGRITLPEDFVPRQVLVTISSPGDAPEEVERSFDWPA